MEISREEFMEQYGDVEVKFVYYYKYKFTYSTSLADGRAVQVSVGGCHDDIYRHEVSNDKTYTINSLYPDVGNVYKNGEVICSFNAL